MLATLLSSTESCATSLLMVSQGAASFTCEMSACASRMLSRRSSTTEISASSSRRRSSSSATSAPVGPSAAAQGCRASTTQARSARAATFLSVFATFSTRGSPSAAPRLHARCSSSNSSVTASLNASDSATRPSQLPGWRSSAAAPGPAATFGYCNERMSHLAVAGADNVPSSSGAPLERMMLASLERLAPAGCWALGGLAGAPAWPSMLRRFACTATCRCDRDGVGIRPHGVSSTPPSRK
mmetsp:Transcript_1057/g.2867  ORF Transcript_1057/g.2867 Transcript_1057/m.2867 type:complete len:241 (+) Transcript_1057:309-1031(+)